MSVVLVLEDMDHRVEWLRERLPSTAEIRHSNTVEGLLWWWHAEPDLVILDHDLGGVPTALGTGSADDNGHTGMDAARRMPVVSCPVIVWSVNPLRAPEMVSELWQRRLTACWLPFGEPRLGPTIANVLMAKESL